MKKLIMVLMVMSLFVLPFMLNATEVVFPFHLRPSSFETLAPTSGAAIGFSAAKLTTSVAGVFCTLETGQLRFRMDGTAPTTSVGHLLEVGQSFTIYNRAALTNIQFIATSTTAALQVTYLTE